MAIGGDKSLKNEKDLLLFHGNVLAMFKGPVTEAGITVPYYLKHLQVQMMTFRPLIKIDFKGEADLLGMEDLQLWVLLHYPGCMVTWKPKSTTLSKKHTAQSCGLLKLNLMPSPG